MTESTLIKDILAGVMQNIRSRGDLRQQVMVRDGYRCWRCGAEAVIACNETNDDKDIETAETMISLCGNCHDKHELGPKIERN